jgi:hypothetical protein
MIKKLLLISCFFSVVLSACEKLDDLTRFNLDAETEFTIPGQQTGLGDILSIPKAEVQTSSEQTFRNNNTRADMVEEARLNKLKLTITAPAQANFDFLNSIEIYIKAEGEKEVLLASKANIPEGTRTLELETTGTDLNAYVKKESYTIRTDAVTDEVVDYDVDVQVDMLFEIKAKVF